MTNLVIGGGRTTILVLSQPGNLSAVKFALSLMATIPVDDEACFNYYKQTPTLGEMYKKQNTKLMAKVPSVVTAFKNLVPGYTLHASYSL